MDDMPYSPCDGCGNVTFTGNGRCLICGHGKSATQKYFDKRFMTLAQRQRRTTILLAIFGIAAALAVLYITLILKVHR